MPKEFEDLYNIDDFKDMPLPPWDDQVDTHQADLQLNHYLPWREAFSKMTPDERKRTILRYYANCSGNAATVFPNTASMTAVYACR